MGKLKYLFICFLVVVTFIFVCLPQAIFAEGEASITVNAPIQVPPGGDFTATVNIGDVSGFDSCNYDVSYDPAIFQLMGVTPGLIGTNSIPVDVVNQISPGFTTIVQNVPGIDGINGTGYLAVLHFHVSGSEEIISNITLSNGTLSSGLAQEIPAVWNGAMVQIDATQPMIISTTPANNETDVSINFPVTVTFSESMDALTLKSDSFTLLNGSLYVSGIVNYNDISKTAIFTPSAPLTYNTIYTVTVTTGVKDLAGNAMLEPYSWSFVTGGQPDLVVSALTVTPDPLIIGDNLTINYTIKNQGTASTGVDFSVGIYLSSDQYGTDTLYSQENIGALAAEASISLTYELRIPSIAPWQYWITLFADDTNIIVESNEDNNIKSAPFYGPVYPGWCDLEVTALSITPSRVVPGSSLKIDYTIINRALESTEGTVNVGIYLSKNQNGTDTQLHQDTEAVLGPFASGSDTYNYSVPPETTPGTYWISVFVDNTLDYFEHWEGNNIFSVSFEVGDPYPPEITPPFLTPTVGEEKVTYSSQNLEVSNGTAPYKWSISKGKLPKGLTLKKNTTNTATISGKPVLADNYTFTVRVTDKNGLTDDQEFSINIYPALSITTTSISVAVVGTEYDQTLSANKGHGAYTWSIKYGSLPPGLSLNEEIGVITGIPDVSIIRAKTYKSRFQVVDELGGIATSKSLSLKVTLPLSVTTQSPLPNGDIGIKYSQILKARGGSGKYNWTLAENSSLPDGFSLSKKGVISGKANAPGTSMFIVVVNDGNTSLEKELSLTINAALEITTVSLPDCLKGQEYTDGGGPVTLKASGGDSKYSWTKSGKFPSGLKLDKTTGIISGTPTKAGMYTFTVKVTDGLKATNTLKLTIIVK